MSRSYSNKTLKLLWSRSAGLCAFPGCRKRLTEDSTDQDPAVVLGEAAHISAVSTKGPRGNRDLSLTDRNQYENLVLLCGHHHTLVDKQPDSYPALELTRWKVEHEQWVRQRTREEIPRVDFPQLEIVCEAILGTHTEEVPDTQPPLAPQEKMDKNGLTDAVRFDLTMGLGGAPKVASFLAGMERLSPNFPEKLKAGFVAAYRRQRLDGFSGDALFEAMKVFSTSGHAGFSRQAAGLVVLSYLFETCDVFER